MAIASTTDAYLALIRRYPLRPIRSDEELDRAAALALELDTRGDLSPDERDYLDVLVTMIGKYEDEAHPIPDVSGPDMLRFLIEDRGLSQAEVARGSGLSGPALSEILAGRRPMGRKVIEKVAGYFGVDPGLFLPAKSAGRGALTVT
jgi:HTH-type transcriptional regulator / antitoxin HigA